MIWTDFQDPISYSERGEVLCSDGPFMWEGRDDDKMDFDFEFGGYLPILFLNHCFAISAMGLISIPSRYIGFYKSIPFIRERSISIT